MSKKFENGKAEYYKLKESAVGYNYIDEVPNLNQKDAGISGSIAAVNNNKLYAAANSLYEYHRLTQDDVALLAQTNDVLRAVGVRGIDDAKLKSHYEDSVKMLNQVVKDSLSTFDAVTSQSLSEWYVDRVDVIGEKETGRNGIDAMWLANASMIDTMYHYFDVYKARDLVSEVHNVYAQPIFSLYNYMECIEDTHRKPYSGTVNQIIPTGTPDANEVYKVRNQLESLRVFCEDGAAARYTPLWDSTPVCQGDLEPVQELDIDSQKAKALDRVLDVYSGRVSKCIELDPDYKDKALFAKDNVKNALRVCVTSSNPQVTDEYMNELDHISKILNKSKSNERRLPDVSGIETETSVEDTCEFE